MLDKLNKFLAPSLTPDQVSGELSQQKWRTDVTVLQRIVTANPAEGFLAAKLRLRERTLQKILRTLQADGQVMAKLSDELTNEEVHASDDERILRHRIMYGVLKTLKPLKVYRLAEK